MYKACVFDLDGTTLYTVEAIRYSISKAISMFGYPQVNEEETKTFIGDGSRTMIERAMKWANNDYDEERIEKAYQEYIRIFKENCMRDVRPYDGLVGILTKMRVDGLKLGIISNKPDARTKDNIYGTYGRYFFDVVYGEREGIPLKPAPDGIINVLDELGVKPEDTLYFGDSDMDMNAGRAAGCTTVACLWGYRPREVLEKCNPDYVLEKVSDMDGIWYNKRSTLLKEK